MDLNKHPRNYIQLRNQIFKLKKKSLPPAIKRIIKKKKKQRNLAKTQPHIFADSLNDINRISNVLTLSKYQKIPLELLNETPDEPPSLEGNNSFPFISQDNNLSYIDIDNMVTNEGQQQQLLQLLPSQQQKQQNIQELIMECNNHIEKGHIPAMVDDLLKISKMQDINAMELNYDQLSDFDLLQIYQSIFIETNIVPYNTGLNIINYTLYKKLKNLNEYPSIQLVSINEIIGNYNKKLLIHGILSPLLAESNFEKFQSQLVTKIFKEIKFTSEEYSLLLKNLAKTKYENTGNIGEIELNEYHLTILQTIVNQKISLNNEILRVYLI